MSQSPPPQPPSGPPPAGPPPAGPPPAGPPSGPPPEILETGGGRPVPPARRGGGRKGVLVGGGIAAIAALGVGGYFAWSAYFATGPQPAEALPDSTVGYVSVDLDPSGSQKLDALHTLEEFPAFNDNVDVEDDDLVATLVQQAQDDGACPDISYADDIEPWLGQRFAVAAVDLGEQSDSGAPEPAVVGVVQVTDADAADEGLTALKECASQATGGGDIGGWSIQGDWAVIAQSDDVAQQVTDAAADAPLSDDDDFNKWTDEAGDPGILTAYASPKAGDLISEAVTGLSALSAPSCAYSAPQPVQPSLPGQSPTDPPVDDYTDAPCGDDYGSDGDVDPEAIGKLYENFGGAAVTVRFDDGSLELESAGDFGIDSLDKIYATDQGGDAVEPLPADTALAFGVGFEDGWFDQLTDFVTEFSGGQADVEAGIAQIEAETGLSLPEDAEALFGQSTAIALGPDFDPQAVEAGDLTGLPLAAKVQGDPDEVEAVLGKLLDNPELGAEADQVTYDSDGEYTVVGLDDGYVDEVLGEGDLGDDDTFTEVVPDADDAASVLYVNADAGNWLVDLAQDDADLAENLEPLSALGISSWQDDDGVAHGLVKITTD